MPHWSTFLDPDGPNGVYLPWKKVEPRVGISRTTAWRMQKNGEFPKPYVVSPGRVAYRESEVEAWNASRGHRTAELVQSRRELRPPRPAPAPASQAAASSAAETRTAPSAPSKSPPKARSRRPVDSRQITFNF